MQTRPRKAGSGLLNHTFHMKQQLSTNALLLIFGLAALFAPACKQEETTTSADAALEETLVKASPDGSGKAYFLLPESSDFAHIPQDPRNSLNSFKVALGQMLFHETAIGTAPRLPGSKQMYSCASCHHAPGGFQACLAQGIGEGGLAFGNTGEARTLDPSYPLDSVDVQPIRSPSAMNAAWQQVMLWNGQFGALGPNVGTDAKWTAGTPKENNHLGYEGVETQAIAGQKVHRLKIDPNWVKSVPIYKFLFDNAFPEVAEADRYTRITAGLAIAAFERTILANQSPWQQWLRGNKNAMSTQEIEGATLFFGKAGCGECHTGPALNSMAFYGYGMGDLLTGNYGAINASPDKAEHKGRGGFTGNQEDMFKFKVPQLYNLSDSPFYGHGATFTKIRDVVDYKNKGVAQKPDVPATQLAAQFKPLGLTDAEVDAITAFLTTALNDPNLRRYEPTDLPSGLCFPNNDLQSRLDRGCQ